MDSQCPKCGGHAARLLEIKAAGGAVYGCLGCGAVIPPISPDSGERRRMQITLHDRQAMPHQVRNWEVEAAKNSQLRALRLALAVKHERDPHEPARQLAHGADLRAGRHRTQAAGAEIGVTTSGLVAWPLASNRWCA